MNPIGQATQQQQSDPTQSPLDAIQQRVQQGSQQLNQEDQARLDQQQQMAISEASKTMAKLNPNLNSSNRIVNNMSRFGQSIATPAYAGYCLQWVDDQQGNTNRQPTAIADYQVRQQAGDISTSGTPPKGARVYFAPDSSNGNMGHVGISDGKGNFTSATDNGVKIYSLSDWGKFTGQKFIGWSK